MLRGVRGKSGARIKVEFGRFEAAAALLQA
jgi:hypothetical protein